jgi:hypothetical protein
MRKLFSNEEYDQVVKLRDDGCSWAEVGARLGRPKASIYTYAKRKGLVLKRLKRTLEEQYWSLVIHDPNYPDRCWQWSGAKCKDGYGLFGHKKINAHRFSYEMHKGPIPKGDARTTLLS